MSDGSAAPTEGWEQTWQPCCNCTLTVIYEERLESRAALSPPAEATNGSPQHRWSPLDRNARKVK